MATLSWENLISKLSIAFSPNLRRFSSSLKRWIIAFASSWGSSGCTSRPVARWSITSKPQTNRSRANSHPRDEWFVFYQTYPLETRLRPLLPFRENRPGRAQCRKRSRAKNSKRRLSTKGRFSTSKCSNDNKNSSFIEVFATRSVCLQFPKFGHWTGPCWVRSTGSCCEPRRQALNWVRKWFASVQLV